MRLTWGEVGSVGSKSFRFLILPLAVGFNTAFRTEARA